MAVLRAIDRLGWIPRLVIRNVVGVTNTQEPAF